MTSLHIVKMISSSFKTRHALLIHSDSYRSSCCKLTGPGPQIFTLIVYITPYMSPRITALPATLQMLRLNTANPSSTLSLNLTCTQITANGRVTGGEAMEG